MNQTKHHHFVLNKPYGYLSQFIFTATVRKNQKLLGELYNFPKETMAIGRLDKPSEGLLLLTTDGKISAQIRSNKVEKEYYVQLDGIITKKAIEQLKKGVEITTEEGRYLTKPSKTKKIEEPQYLQERSKSIRDNRHGPTSWISIIITEGKFRQVRKMTAKVGFPTLRLIRVRIGEITIKKLKAGEVIEVNSFFSQ